MAGLVLPYRGVVPAIDPSAFVAPTAVVAGDVVIGAESNVWFGCVLRGDTDVIRVGRRTNIQDGTVVHTSSAGFGAIIGDEVTIGHMALIHACTLESGCFIGMKACVMDGAVVESGAMVAAGGLVTPRKRVPKGELWGGAPARKLRDISEDEIAWFHETVERYVQLGESYRSALLTRDGDGLPTAITTAP
jgi:gamma-carbonic anhydrase